MRLLIITSNVGRTAPGIVFEKLIRALSSLHAVDLITADYDPGERLISVKNKIIIKKKSFHPRIAKFLIGIFNISPIDWLWSKSVLKKLDKKKCDYDLVLSFISFHHYTALITGFQISRKKEALLGVYSVDAIPAPLGWSKNDCYFKGVNKMMRKYLSQADLFFSSNYQMLSYQLSTFVPKNGLLSDVIYTPCDCKLSVYGTSFNNKNTFLYTGGIYGARKIEYILEAFKKVLNNYPNSSLEFVGASFPKNLLSIFDESDKEKVIFHPFKNDLTEHYRFATALIDVDADLPDDVFLSSKITNYITINRTIICETGENSPSRNIFKGIPSIIQCSHDVGQLANAMERAILDKNRINIHDRAEVIKLFKLESVVDKLNNTLLKKYSIDKTAPSSKQKVL